MCCEAPLRLCVLKSIPFTSRILNSTWFYPEAKRRAHMLLKPFVSHVTFKLGLKTQFVSYIQTRIKN